MSVFPTVLPLVGCTSIVWWVQRDYSRNRHTMFSHHWPHVTQIPPVCVCVCFTSWKRESCLYLSSGLLIIDHYLKHTHVQCDNRNILSQVWSLWFPFQTQTSDQILCTVDRLWSRGIWTPTLNNLCVDRSPVYVWLILTAVTFSSCYFCSLFLGSSVRLCWGMEDHNVEL